MDWGKKLLEISDLSAAQEIQTEVVGWLRTQKLKSPKKEDIHFVVGVDISTSKENPNFGVACAVLWDIDAKMMIESCIVKDNIYFPYSPGFLGFREIPLMKKAIEGLSHTYDLILTDGHGRIHPRYFGEAVHLGVVMDRTTIGVAKNPFYGVFPSDWRNIPRIKGNRLPCIDEITPSPYEGGILGYSIVAKDNSKPIFVSIGYKSSENLFDLVLEVTLDHRIPEPIFLADQISRAEIKEVTNIA